MAESVQPEKTVDVFISYSRRDKSVADKVHQRVTQRGLSCFYDTRSINIGDLWRDQLYSAILSARTMILIISRNSLDSKEVLRETNKALSYETVICPIVVGNVDRQSKLCRFVDEYHWLESKEPPGDDELDLLVERVAAIVGVDRKMPQLTIIKPQGGERFEPGKTYSLSWDISAPPGTSILQIGMELLQNGVPVYAFPGKESPWAGTVRECQWTVPASLAAGDYQVRMHAINNLGHVGAGELAAPITMTGPAVAPSAAMAPEIAKTDVALPVAGPAAAPPVAAALRVIEPAAKARWTRGRTEVLRVEVTAQGPHSLTVELASASGPPRRLAELNSMQLLVKMSVSAANGSVMIPANIPLQQAAGPATLRVALKDFHGSTVAAADVPVEIAESSAAERVAQFEQQESISLGIGFAGMCALVVYAILLLKQCLPIVGTISWSSLNWDLSRWSQLGQQLLDGFGASFSTNNLAILVTAVVGGLIIAAGSFIWASKAFRWLGGMLVGIGWGAGVGLAISALGADGPKLPPRQEPFHRDWSGLSGDSPSLNGPKLRPGFGTLNDRFGSQAKGLLESTTPTEPSTVTAPTASDDAVDDATRELAAKMAWELFQQSRQSPLGQTTDPTAPAQPEPGSTGIELTRSPLLEHLQESSSDSAAPDWHKVPVRLSLIWILWGALIGAVIGGTSPLWHKPA